MDLGGFVVLFFSLSGTKLPHYVLYGITPLFILIAAHRDTLRRAWLHLAAPNLLLAVFPALPWIFSALSNSTAGDAYYRAQLGRALELADARYYIGTLAALLIWIVVMLRWRQALWKRLVVAAALQVTVLAALVVPLRRRARPGPVRDMAIKLREMDEAVTLKSFTAPSISVYRQAVTQREAGAGWSRGYPHRPYSADGLRHPRHRRWCRPGAQAHRMTARRSAALLLVIGLLVTAYRLWVIRHLGIDLYVDEAYYWGWSKALDWGYFSKPPVIAALIAASTAAFGDGILAVKLPALLLYPATSLVLAALGTRLFDARIGFWSGLAFLTMPLVGALGLFVSTDAPLLFFWSLGMLFLLRALEHQRWRDWLGLGLAVGWACCRNTRWRHFCPRHCW